MAELTACLIGLGETGISLGLALKQAKVPFRVVGHDKDRGRMGLAQNLKAVDKTLWNVHRAVEDADLVVMGLPLAEMTELLPLLTETYKPESLVLILTSVMQSALELARAHVPANVSYVLGHPILTGINAPVTERADLFTDILFCLAPGPDTAEDALRVAHNLIEHLGAKPHYLDAAEHDGLIAGVEHTAHVLAGAYMHAAAQGAGWYDARKLGGRVFYHATDLTRSPRQLSSSLLANREYIVTWLDIMQRELVAWRQLLEAGDEEALTALTEEVHAARMEWEKGAALQEWGETVQTGEGQTSGSIMRQMFLGNLMSRRRLPPSRDEEPPGRS